MTVWTEIADPGTRETVGELLSLCGITPGASGPEGMLRIADYGPDMAAGPEECAVFLVSRELSGEVLSAGGSGGRALFLPVPILLEEGIRTAWDQMHADRIFIEAEDYVEGYYAKAGFTRTSDVFLKDDIPHIHMELWR